MTRRSARTVRPEDRPLDPGVIDGPEVWREVDGVTFCHWDRWLLRLALDEKGGLPALAWTLRERVTDPKRLCDKDAAEALHLQMVDLQRRLDEVQRAPEVLLDDEERASRWLYRKAFQRVWRSGPNRRTKAMLDTPRRRFEARAMRGHWEAFPVSPARFESALTRVVGDLSNAPYWATSHVARAIELDVEMRAIGATLEERVALYRAAMAVIVDAMASLDDSGADMAMTYEEIERAYLGALRELPEHAPLLPDLVEFATWEDYGLTVGVEDFLAGLSEGYADAALRALARLIRELREERLEYSLARARGLRAVVLRAASAITETDVDE
jgi:hypothetical protein